MPESNIELVRRLTEGFSEVDFKRFRDSLAEAEGLGDAGSMVGHDFHGERGWLEGMYARRRSALADLAQD